MTSPLKLFRTLLITLLFMLPLPSLAHTPASLLEAKVPSLAPMLAKVTPSVVNITVEKIISSFSFDPAIKKKKDLNSVAVGSGVVVNAKQGLIVTNAHVVKNARIIIVTLKDGSRYRAKLMGLASGFDIAVIKINARHLTSIAFGDSSKLRVGDFVAAIGSPFGLSQTVTSGVISGLNRSRPRIEGYQSFIQTDAPINPGNSGGALVNLAGQLIGINTAIYTPVDGNVGIGFAIPSNMVKSVVDQLIRYGKVKKGFLGVVAQNITTDLANALNIKHDQGVIVTQVIFDSPAAKAGIKVRDIILAVNNKAVNSAVQLRNMLGLMRPGTAIHITVIRNHKPIMLDATVGNPKAVLKQQAIPFLSGTNLRNFSELRGNGKMLTGVLVTQVSNLSAAALAGLEAGDVITNANGQRITSVTQLEQIALHNSKQLLLKATRKQLSLFLVIEP